MLKQLAMGLLNLTLDLACVLLLLNWRAHQIAPLEKSPPVSLAATLKKAEPRRGHHWLSLVTLLAILVVRSFFYWDVGSALKWTPSLNLGVVRLVFRSDYLSRMLVFSMLSFGLLAAGGYAWLLLISVINRKVGADEPVQRLVRLHLGWIERWPAWLKLFVPMAFSILVWGFGNPALVQLGIVPAPISRVQLWEQAFVLGLASFLAWKFLLLALCLLYLVNCYVYMGKAYFWNFVNTTGANLLAPLRRFPIRSGKWDLSPVLGGGLILAVSHWSALWLPQLFERLPL
jgi:hypothetical protein